MRILAAPAIIAFITIYSGLASATDYAPQAQRFIPTSPPAPVAQRFVPQAPRADTASTFRPNATFVPQAPAADRPNYVAPAAFMRPQADVVPAAQMVDNSPQAALRADTFIPTSPSAPVAQRSAIICRLGYVLMREKPRVVLYAEWSLWIWTTWACLFGMYQTYTSLPEMEQQLTDAAQGMLTIEPQTLLTWSVVGYLIGAALSVWFVLKIGEGKHWARSSLLWGFVMEILWTLCPPYHELSGYLADIPDLGLQIGAIYLLYTSPGREWFAVTPAGKK